jgi:hypothetical protein
LVNLKCCGGSRNIEALCSGLRESFCKWTAGEAGTVRPQYLLSGFVFQVTDIHNGKSWIFRYTDVLLLILGSTAWCVLLFSSSETLCSTNTCQQVWSPPSCQCDPQCYVSGILLLAFHISKINFINQHEYHTTRSDNSVSTQLCSKHTKLK